VTDPARLDLSSDFGKALRSGQGVSIVGAQGLFEFALSLVWVYTLCIYSEEGTMRTRVQKWGNSLAVRIPKSFAAEVGIGQDSPVELSLVDGRLVVTPTPVRAVTLEALLAGITDTDIHREVDTGAPVGSEAW